MLQHHYKTFAAYNRWANDILYDAAAQLSAIDYHADRGAFFGSVHGTLNHILVADRIWMHRMSGNGPDYKILDTKLADDFDTLRDLRKAEDARIIAFIDGLAESDFAKPCQYATTEGLEYEQPFADILPHFFNHQTHHRGQASTLFTQYGLPAPEMDLAYYVRGLLDKAA